jgi:hypothetical protein
LVDFKWWPGTESNLPEVLNRRKLLNPQWAKKAGTAVNTSLAVQNRYNPIFSLAARRKRDDHSKVGIIDLQSFFVLVYESHVSSQRVWEK